MIFLEAKRKQRILWRLQDYFISDMELVGMPIANDGNGGSMYKRIERNISYE